jgi:PAS domain S-box-containing protein
MRGHFVQRIRTNTKSTFDEPSLQFGLLDATALPLGTTDLHALLEAMPNMVWTARCDGSTEWLSSKWKEYTGLSMQESIGWGWASVVHPDDMQRCVLQWKQAVATESPYRVEYRFRRADGTYRWHMGKASPMYSASRQIIRWVGTCTDIHDQKIAELALLEKNFELAALVFEKDQACRQRDDLLGAVAHDLKVPLIGALRALNILSEGVLGPLEEQQLDFISKMIRSHSQLLQIVDDIVHSYQMDHSGNGIACSEFDLIQLIKNSMHEMLCLAGARNIEVSFSLPEQLTLRAEQASVHRLLINLVGNAVKHTPEGGWIKIAARAQDDYVEIATSNAGYLSPEASKRLFAKFGQNETSNRYLQGSGLGLYLCRQIMEAHGGTLECESHEATTTFRARFPNS